MAEATQGQSRDEDRGLLTWPLTHLASGAFKKRYAVRWDPGQVRRNGSAGEAERGSFPAEETSSLAAERKSQEILAALTFLSS